MLFRSWKNQSLSEKMRTILFNLMESVEPFIKKNAPGSLYGEWAKKEECWSELKSQNFDIDLSKVKSDFEDPKNPVQRKRMTEEDSLRAQVQEELDTIRSIPPEIWHKIEKWGRATGELSEQKKTVVFNIAGRVRNNTKISDYERQTAITILEAVIEKMPSLLDAVDEINGLKKNGRIAQANISLETIQKIVQWDKKNKKLRVSEFVFMSELAKGNKPLTDRNKFLALSNLTKVKKLGFTE